MNIKINLILFVAVLLIIVNITIFGQPQNLKNNENQETWKEDVTLVWKQIMEARKSMDTQPSMSELEHRFDKLVEKGISNGYHIALTEEVSKPNVEFLGIPKGEAVIGGVPKDEAGKNQNSTSKQSEDVDSNAGLFVGKPVIMVYPQFPIEARGINASGDVNVEVTVSKKGTIIEAKCLNGHPIFHKASLSAASQWRFIPSTIDKVPVNVSGVLTFRFVKPY